MTEHEKIKMIADAIARQANAAIHQYGAQVQEHLGKMFAEVKGKVGGGPQPRNPVVQVMRMNEDGEQEPVQTTIPQLLAELNDNMLELIDITEENFRRQRKKTRKKKPD